MENVHERLEAMEGALQVMQAERQSLRRRLRCWRTAGFALIALILLLFGSSPGQAFDSTLEQRVAVLESLLAHFSRSGNEVYITGANLHIRNGLRATNGYLLDPGSISPSVTRTNGLGNLIIGYNEAEDPFAIRDGSHNLVVGTYHEYDDYGGIVVGRSNRIFAPYACVSGGVNNSAHGFYSSISGGGLNNAGGDRSSVSGGRRNSASGDYSSLSGGNFNGAFGDFSSIAGGRENSAVGYASSVTGGFQNGAIGMDSSVSGGFQTSQSSGSGWAAGSLGAASISGRFRSP